MLIPLPPGGTAAGLPAGFSPAGAAASSLPDDAAAGEGLAAGASPAGCFFSARAAASISSIDIFLAMATHSQRLAKGEEFRAGCHSRRGIAINSGSIDQNAARLVIFFTNQR
jgi:hypothetical protein